MWTHKDKLQKTINWNKGKDTGGCSCTRHSSLAFPSCQNSKHKTWYTSPRLTHFEPVLRNVLKYFEMFWMFNAYEPFRRTIDWCGCSPHVIRSDTLPKMQKRLKTSQKLVSNFENLNTFLTLKIHFKLWKFENISKVIYEHWTSEKNKEQKFEQLNL